MVMTLFLLSTFEISCSSCSPLNYHFFYFAAFSSCLITFPIHICEDEEADFEALMSTDARSIGFKSRVYANPRFKQVAMKMLPIFDSKGVLDEL